MGKVGHAPAMAVRPRQSGSQGTIVRKETAAEIRQEVLKNGEEVYRLTCSDARAIDEAWRDLSAWMETVLIGLWMFAGTSLSASILLVAAGRKAGSNLSAQVEGLETSV